MASDLKGKLLTSLSRAKQVKTHTKKKHPTQQPLYITPVKAVDSTERVEREEREERSEFLDKIHPKNPTKKNLSKRSYTLPSSRYRSWRLE